MATKSPNTHGKIPTVSELLENPSIRGLADRWNRSVVMSGVRSFLDEVRNDLARRGEGAEWPSLRELAEKAARHVVASQQPSQRAAINATGRVWGGPWVGRPQSDMALQHAFAAGREFVAGADAASASPAAGDVESLLCRVTGARATVAVHSYSGGLWLALTAIAAGREVLVARGEMGEAESSCPIADVIDASGATLCEVGATNRATTADYEAAAMPHTAALLRLSPEHYSVVGETESAELDALVGLARDREIVLIDALGNAPLVDRSTQFSWPGRSLQASLTAGADLAIVRGDGMAGGPTCGILAGDRTLIERIVAHPLFAAW
jgi:L-seryl-tRNA(Ser) seleniumtransferase